MTLTTCTVSGDIPLPDAQYAATAQVVFALTGHDTTAEDEIVLPGAVIANISDDGALSVALWPNAEGLRGTQYSITVRWLDGTTWRSKGLGNIEVPESATANLADLLGVTPENNPGVTAAVAASAALAKKYATEVEDTPVETGPDTFSALHYAAKADADATEAAASAAAGAIARVGAEAARDEARIIADAVVRKPIAQAAYARKISQVPPLAHEEAMLVVDHEHGVYFKGAQGSGFGEGIPYADVNAIPGIQRALKATGLPAPHRGADGNWKLVVHNFAAKNDMSLGVLSGSAEGAYKKVSGLSASNDFVYFHADVPLVPGDKVRLIGTVKGVSGETGRLRVRRFSTSVAYEETGETVTFTGEDQPVDLTHTVINAQPRGVVVDIGWAGIIATASEFEVKDLWFYVEEAAQGWKMENRAGWTHETIPEDLTFGIGVRHENGRPVGDTLGTGYSNGIRNNVFSGAVVGVVGSGGALPTGMTATGVTTTTINSVGPDVLDVTFTTNNSGGGAIVYPRLILAGPTAGNVISAAQFAQLQMEMDVTALSGLSTGARVARSVTWFTSGGAGNGENGETPGLTATGSLTERRRVQAPASTVLVGAQVYIPSLVGIGDTTTVRVVLRSNPQLVANAVDMDYPIIPTVPGGQNAHASQPFDADLTDFALLDANVYSGKGKTGVIGTSDEPWASAEGEDRFALSAAGDLTITAGSASETCIWTSNLAATNAAKVKMSINCTAGQIIAKDAAGATKFTINAGESREIEYQSVIGAGGAALQITATATGVGTVSGIDVYPAQQGEWVLALKAKLLVATDAPSYPRVASLADSTEQSAARVLMSTVAHKFYGEVIASGVNQGSYFPGQVFVLGESRSFAMRVATDSVQAAENGVAALLDNDVTVPNFSRLGILTRATGQAQSGVMIQSFALLHRRTTEAELLHLAPGA